MVHLHCETVRLQLRTRIDNALLLILATQSLTGRVPYRRGFYIIDASKWSLGMIIVRFFDGCNPEQVWQREVPYSSADTVALIIQRAGKPSAGRSCNAC